MARKSALYGETHDNGGTHRSVAVLPPEFAPSAAGSFPVERLDSVIATLVHNAQSGAEMLQKYTPLLEIILAELQTQVSVLLASMQQAQRAAAVGEPPPSGLAEIVDLSGKVSVIMERLSKMTMQSVKSKDDATRLRSHLSGDQDRGLENLSETALRKLVMDAAQGWLKPEDA